MLGNLVATQANLLELYEKSRVLKKRYMELHRDYTVLVRHQAPGANQVAVNMARCMKNYYRALLLVIHYQAQLGDAHDFYQWSKVVYDTWDKARQDTASGDDHAIIRQSYEELSALEQLQRDLVDGSDGAIVQWNPLSIAREPIEELCEKLHNIDIDDGPPSAMSLSLSLLTPPRVRSTVSLSGTFTLPRSICYLHTHT